MVWDVWNCKLRTIHPNHISLFSFVERWVLIMTSTQWYCKNLIWKERPYFIRKRLCTRTHQTTIHFNIFFCCPLTTQFKMWPNTITHHGKCYNMLCSFQINTNRMIFAGSCCPVLKLLGIHCAIATLCFLSVTISPKKHRCILTAIRKETENVRKRDTHTWKIFLSFLVFIFGQYSFWHQHGNNDCLALGYKKYCLICLHFGCM